MTPKPLCWQRWKALNDSNGNPRRLYVQFDKGGNIMRVYDEGYAGKPKDLVGPELACVNIMPSEYRLLKRSEFFVSRSN